MQRLSRRFGLQNIVRSSLVLLAGTLLAAGVWAAQTAAADPAPTISGVVRFNGVPAPRNSINNGVDLLFMASGGSRYGTQTDANGAYSKDASTMSVGDYAMELSYNAPYPQQNSALTNMPNSFLLTTSTPVFYYGNAPVTQDYDFTTKTIAVTVHDHNNAVVSGREVSVQNIGAGTVTTTGGVSFGLPDGRGMSQGITNSSGVATVAVFPGMTYRVCVRTGYIYPTEYCSTPVLVTDDTTASITYAQPPTISGSLRFNGLGLPYGTASVAFVTPTVSGDTYNGQTNTNASSDYAFNAGYLFARSYGVILQYNVSYAQENSATSGVPNSFLLRSTTPIIDYGYTNVSKDFAFTTKKLVVTVKDAAGNPISTHVSVTSTGDNTVTAADGTTFGLAANQGQSTNPTVNGVATVSIFTGVNYNACALIQNVQHCTPVNISDDSTAIIAPAPGTPTNLAAASPTMKPVLTWTAASGAISYQVYRDTTLIGTATTTTYTDQSASNGSHSYFVKAANASVSGAASNTISVTVDTVRPSMEFTAPTSFAGPFASGPTVSVTASDLSGLQVLVIHVYNSSNQLLSTCGTATPTQLAAGTMSCNLSNLPAGSYSIKAGSFDLAGNNKTITSGTFSIL